MDYEQSDEKFHFTFHDPSSLDQMRLKSDLLKNENPNFAIDFYHPGPNFDQSARNCEKNSDKQLKRLIADCDGDSILRNLTEEEKNQLQQYKNEQKGKRSQIIGLL